MSSDLATSDARGPSHTLRSAGSYSAPEPFGPSGKTDVRHAVLQLEALPAAVLERDPCNIVCLVDTSGSMNETSPKGKADEEESGFTRMDLAKHALVVLVHSLGPQDTLCIITFQSHCDVLFKPANMNHAARDRALDCIAGMQAGGRTSMWAALQIAWKIIMATKANTQVLLLTDGCASDEPTKSGGLAKAFSELYTTCTGPVTLHTIGFGYGINSTLLQSLAQTACGVYAFVPDASMIGTVFVNILSTFLATAVVRAQLVIHSREATEVLGFAPCLEGSARSSPTKPTKPKVPDQPAGKDKSKSKPVRAGSSSSSTARAASASESGLQSPLSRSDSVKFEIDTDGVVDSATAGVVKVTVDIGPLQHTQSRTVTLLVPAGWTGRVELQACTWGLPTKLAKTCIASLDGHAVTEHLSDALLLAEARDLVVTVIHAAVDGKTSKAPAMRQLHQDLLALSSKAAGDSAREAIAGLATDAWDAGEHLGQLSHAVASDAAFTRWGGHYLRSEQRAHSLHVCLNFKDAGLQAYAAPLFSAMQARAEELFCTLPAPTPTGLAHGDAAAAGPSNMASFYNVSGG